MPDLQMVPEGGGGGLPVLRPRVVIPVLSLLLVAGCGGGGVPRAAVWRDLALRQTPLRPRRRRSRQAGDAQPQHSQGSMHI